ncbi:MAG TPA: tRNA (N(6)-L-threonylcarbamoyladenosine(37)-C(2))-methylthiotransferase MtaB [Treponemataceae bacterium]|nr:tRNA (N(6)-L-threonylcarbamoyladenosine(37)-C(2))-methylthiotransferase MtaB [Treponemataceae bacterium]
MQNAFNTIHFETLGCKLNQIETESAVHFFSEALYSCTTRTVLAKQKPDNSTILCIINTCTVTSKAEQKCRRVIRLLLKKYPCAAILVTGCYAQLDAKILSNIDKRIAILGGQSKAKIAHLPVQIATWYKNKELVPGDSLALASKMHFLFANTAQQAFGKTINAPASSAPLPSIKQTIDPFVFSTNTFMNHSRSSIKIQDGCNNTCSFCRICFARGPSVSLEAEIVLDRIQNLEKAHHKEVVITGVNLSQYAVSIPKNCKTLSTNHDYFDFAQLLEFLIKNTNDIRFRISSLYPERIDDDMCSVLAHERVQPHFHLSVQSGSNAILHSMHRPYKAEHIIKAVKKLRIIKQNPFIACDIITGFPGETASDFEKTVHMCKTCNFAWIHAFPFSARPGTKAYTMKNQIPHHIAKERVALLTSLAKKNKKEYVKTCIGKTFYAIVEKRESHDLRVVTENFLHLFVLIPENKKTKHNCKTLGGTQVLIKVHSKVPDKKEISEIDGYCTIIL